ncbi:MAG: DUF5050 domain-containing protein [Coprobacillus sp.]
MYCQKCKREIDDDSLFCVHCGQEVKRCSHCHNVVGENDQYCSHCGNNLSIETTPTYNSYQPMNNNRAPTQEQIGGYYQPLKDVSFEETGEETVQFEDIPQSKKVNRKVIGISCIVILALTVIGYFYLQDGNNPQFKETPHTSNEVIQNEMTIQSTTSAASHVGNINISGTAVFDGKMLYACDENGYIVKMDSKLENRVTLVKQKSSCLNVVNDIIYYTNEKNNLCSITTDGKDQKLILNKNVFYLSIQGDKAYYQLDEGEGDGEYICVYDLKTNKETKLNDKASYNLNVIGDKIYYSSTDGIYCMNTDGKAEEKLVSGKVINVIVQDNKVYYMRDDRKTIGYFDLTTKKIEDLITKDVAIFLNVTDQYIFYLNNDFMVTRYDLKSKEIKTIYNSSASGLQVIGDKVIIDTVGKNYENKKGYKVIMDFDGNVQQRLFAENDGTFI